jgi:hypothetical protein
MLLGSYGVETMYYNESDASINNTQEYTLVYVFVRSANSELTYKSTEQFI